MTAPHPFRYPVSLARKHGPAGYVQHRSYRPWLRDEFVFRCAYCLSRETWSRTFASFDLDHFQPRTLRSDLVLAYDNLVYACHGCNLSKGSCTLEIPTATNLEVDRSGSIFALDNDGQRVIDLLSLDDERSTRFRRTVIGIVRSLCATPSEHETFALWMGFPTDDLPDLATLKPVANSRPRGIDDSWHARHERGTLPPYYE